MLLPNHHYVSGPSLGWDSPLFILIPPCDVLPKPRHGSLAREPLTIPFLGRPSLSSQGKVFIRKRLTRHLARVHFQLCYQVLGSKKGASAILRIGWVSGPHSSQSQLNINPF